ncbi:MAG: ABC transporter permease [Rhodobacteraceae bacterium]|nr:ABC transporter permease [Paracoccaceae bacterium]
MEALPKWADAVLVPLISIVIAFAISALVILAIGENPLEAMRLMVEGAIASTYGWGYTLFYATNFIFTGLAVAVAFHAGLFNIGGEGQATLGGLGVALVLLNVAWPHWTVALAAAVLGAMAFGALWALVPAWLQAKRGSHIVITTIMFNFIAAALLNYLLVNVLKPAGQMDPATARFAAATVVPKLAHILGAVGIPFNPRTPANIALVLALVAAFLVWILLWHTRLGYQVRAFGKSEPAARYAGISPVRITLWAMLISGGLAGLMTVNTVMGEAQRLVMNVSEGAGFIGIAVALMGRSHPVGVVLAALLFGFLYQGGAELEFWTSITRELIVVIQALVILFTGALDEMVRAPLARLFVAIRGRR